MTKVVVIGATSAIAEHCARIWADRGDVLYLVGRNEERVNAIAADLKVRGASQVYAALIDLNDTHVHAALLDTAEAAMGGIDIVLIAHGTLSDQAKCEKNVSLTLQEINTNAFSTISLLTHIANRMEVKNEGVIAIISSVAGDRGRASNYVYGCAKAMVTTFTSGLRQRLHPSRVAVVTIKPGFVDTPMTAELRKNLLWVKPEVVAKRIVRAIDSGETEIYAPSFWLFIMFVVKAIPTVFFQRLKL
jgi:decaprenylphospho-beta-D-erythro-pentofuranosid-2-ulose 2-reductase